MIEVTSYEEARDSFRSRDLRQALYEDGHRLMTGVIVNLHGDAHIARRRLENRLFRRDTFAWYERERIPRIIETVLTPAVAAGQGDLLTLARRTMMTLSIDVAGVDLPSADDPDVEQRFELLYDIMNRLAKASTVAHAVGDVDQIKADGDEALATFADAFFRSSHERRRRLVEQVESGMSDESELPRDVLTTLLRNQDRLDLPDSVVLREVAYFPWVGSHSTSAQLVHAMHHVFEWIDECPGDRQRLIDDPERLQRLVHESMRLHPASPVAMRIATTDVELRSGRLLPEGETISIRVEAANRDESIFGPHPNDFDPDRQLADGVPPWGLSFGHGSHACLGQELASGLEPDEALEHHLLGSVALMAAAMLRAGARPHPTDRAELDRNTTRVMWGRYPVRFGDTS